jgi:hypothetical protein
MKARATIVCVLALLLTACATQRFGRAISLSDAEKRLMTCDQVDLEIAKNDAFMKQTAETNAKFTGKEVLGFLGDFGIGNSMEYGEAMKSGTVRASELSDLRTQKNCTKAAVPASG